MTSSSLRAVSVILCLLLHCNSNSTSTNTICNTSINISASNGNSRATLASSDLLWQLVKVPQGTDFMQAVLVKYKNYSLPQNMTTSANSCVSANCITANAEANSTDTRPSLHLLSSHDLGWQLIRVSQRTSCLPATPVAPALEVSLLRWMGDSSKLTHWLGRLGFMAPYTAVTATADLTELHPFLGCTDRVSEFLYKLRTWPLTRHHRLVFVNLLADDALTLGKVALYLAILGCQGMRQHWLLIMCGCAFLTQMAVSAGTPQPDHCTLVQGLQLLYIIWWGVHQQPVRGGPGSVCFVLVQIALLCTEP